MASLLIYFPFGKPLCKKSSARCPLGSQGPFLQHLQFGETVRNRKEPLAYLKNSMFGQEILDQTQRMGQRDVMI